MEASFPGIPEEGHGHQGEESGIQRVGDDDPPEARLAPDKIQEIILTSRVELPGILSPDEVLKDKQGMRIQPEPEAEKQQGRDHRHAEAPGILFQEGAWLPAAGAELPERHRENDRDDEGKGFVEEGDPDHSPADPGPDDTFGKFGLPMKQQEGKGSEEPEGLRGACQKDPSIAVGAEEAEEKKRCRDAQQRVAGAPDPDQHEKPRRQQGVENIRGAKAGQGPLVAPVRRGDALPEKEGRFGIAQTVIRRLKGKQFPRLGREARDLGVEKFVAVGCQMITPKSCAIDEERQEQGGQTDQQGAMPLEMMMGYGMGMKMGIGSVHRMGRTPL